LIEAFEEYMRNDIVACTEHGIDLGDAEQVNFFHFSCLMMNCFQVFLQIKKNVMDEGGGSYYRFLRTLHNLLLIPPSPLTLDLSRYRAALQSSESKSADSSSPDLFEQDMTNSLSARIWYHLLHQKLYVKVSMYIFQEYS
jgi:hypothetical protein